MDIQKLRYFIQVVEKGSISQAAEAMYMAQSSLSKSIRSLETELGTTLFARTSTGVRLTNSGKYFQEYAQRTLHDYYDVVCQVNDIDNHVRGRVDFGISSYRGRYLIPRILQKFRQTFAAVDVVIHEYNSIELYRRVGKGEMDLVLIAQYDNLEGYSETIFQDEIVIACKKGHELAQFARSMGDGTKNMWIDLRDAEKYEFILSNSASILGREARRLFSRYSVRPESLNDDITADFAVAMAEAGLGICFTYKSCTHENQGIDVYSIGEDRELLNLALLYPPDKYRSKATSALRQMIVDNIGKDFPDRDDTI